MQLKNSRFRSLWLSVLILFVIWTGWLLKHQFFPKSRLLPFQRASPLSLSTTGFESGNQTVSDRPLILYAYFDTENARRNLEYFLLHALHDGADFVFVLNGEDDIESIIPNEPNIRFVRRKNECYDLGAFAEVLIKDDLYKKYNKFITMNASIRGPFLPYWATGCWTDMFLDRVTNTTKLVGMTVNCEGPVPHIQSMIWATDRIGIETLLYPTVPQIARLKTSLKSMKTDTPVPNMQTPGINSCPSEYWNAVAVEVYASPLIEAAGYKIDAMMTAFHANPNYEAECADIQDVLYEEKYFGINLHPYDSIFAKANRGTNAVTLKKYTEWMDESEYSSYDHCGSRKT